MIESARTQVCDFGNDDAGCGIHIGKARFSADEIPIDVVLNELHSA